MPSRRCYRFAYVILDLCASYPFATSSCYHLTILYIKNNGAVDVLITQRLSQLIKVLCEKVLAVWWTLTETKRPINNKASRKFGSYCLMIWTDIMFRMRVVKVYIPLHNVVLLGSVAFWIMYDVRQAFDGYFISLLHVCLVSNRTSDKFNFMIIKTLIITCTWTLRLLANSFCGTAIQKIAPQLKTGHFFNHFICALSCVSRAHQVIMQFNYSWICKEVNRFNSEKDLVWVELSLSVKLSLNRFLYFLLEEGLSSFS